MLVNEIKVRAVGCSMSLRQCIEEKQVIVF